MVVENGNDRKFITTEPLEDQNVGGQQAWNTIRKVFANRSCLGYWRYPLFSHVDQRGKEPDIVIADRELGVCVFEIVGATIGQIASIDEDSWTFQNLDLQSDSPSTRCQQQLQALISHCDPESTISQMITGRAMIVLPLVTEAQWQQKGLEQLPGSPPIIFQDFLGEKKLVQKIQQSTPIIQGVDLNDEQWQLLLAVLGGTAILRNPPEPSNTKAQPNGISRASVITTLQESLYELDLQQVHIGTEIPPGPQRIRGIAGSGKTVLLCQKAAHMSLKHPDWAIALVFFTRSLYDHIEGLIDRWIRYFSNDQATYDDKAKQTLKVLHAWGARDQPGLYGEIAAHHHKTRGARVKGLAPNQGLAYRCKEFLEALDEIEPMFDAILIDEGQDLVIEKDQLKYQEKQAIYWLAYQALKPIKSGADERRLIWAYDEAQSLDNLVIPTAPSLFGKGFERMVSGTHKGGIKKSEIMYRCYRTPGPILTAAHAIGMGLLRPDGMISGITNAVQWRAIGYEVTGKFQSGQEVTLHRPPKNSPNLVPQLWSESVLEFNLYPSRSQELTALAQNIQVNLEQDGLKPSREILVVVLGPIQEAMQLEAEVSQFLMKQDINVYIPSAPSLNTIKFSWQTSQPNKFWWDGGVTVSRIHRAKGNEADMVYVIGCDNVAQDEANVGLRNQLFVALTRARGWAVLSGIGDYPMYQEIQTVIDSGDTFTFTFKRPPKRSIDDDAATGA